MIFKNVNQLLIVLSSLLRNKKKKPWSALFNILPCLWGLTMYAKRDEGIALMWLFTNEIETKAYLNLPNWHK